MAGNSKKPASKKTTGSKTKKAAPKAAAKPKKPRAPKPGPRCIRNLLGVQQNLRLRGDREKPYSVTLRPRGQRGDAVWVPLACQEDTAFLSGLDRQFEIITEAEFKKLQSEYPPVGYMGRQPMMPNLRDGTLEPVNVTVVRPQETIVNKTVDPYAQTAEAGLNKPARTTPVGPNLVQMPGGMGTANGGESNAAIMAQIDAQANGRKPKGA